MRNYLPLALCLLLQVLSSTASTSVNALPEEPDPSRASRLAWWKDARLGVFIHYGPYAVLAHGEWAMQQENIPLNEYTPLAQALKTKPGAPRVWARLAKEAGAGYMVLTAKHCDGFALWDSHQSDFNSVKTGPGRDLVAEYIAACREVGLKVGLYYSLMDWRHPDGDRCAVDEAARKRFVEYTHNNVRELMSRYGKIDLLWFDGPWPMPTPEQWESRKLVDEVRKLQPHILINNRARLAEDYSTPEGSVAPQALGRAWEACLTLNGDWGFSQTPEGDWVSVRDMLRMLRSASAFGGNLLLNIGPRGDGTLPEEAHARFSALGHWLQVHGEAVYGQLTRLDGKLEPWLNTGYWTLREKTAYYWLLRGDPSPRFSLARVQGKVNKVSVLHSGCELPFRQDAQRLLIEQVPPLTSEAHAQTPVLKIEFENAPHQQLGAGLIPLPDDKAAWW